ncbi:hypothetical protein [Thermococcus sp.]
MKCNLSAVFAEMSIVPSAGNAPAVSLSQKMAGCSIWAEGGTMEWIAGEDKSV